MEKLLSQEAQDKIESVLQYHFRNRVLLTRAFTRASFRNEHPECQDNEVPELIGDSVLGLATLSEIHRFSEAEGMNWNEGKISNLKHSLVSKRPLAERMRPWNFEQYLIVSSGDRRCGICKEDSVLEDLAESIIGAVYMDSGYNFPMAAQVAENLLHLREGVRNNAAGIVHLSFRNDLQNWTQDRKRQYGVPKYDITEDSGNRFHAVVSIPELGYFADGYGKNSKMAGEEAAKQMLLKLQKKESWKPDFDAVELKIGSENSNFEPVEQKNENYIGILNQRLQSMKEEPADFRLEEEVTLPGNLHCFTVSCTWKKLTARGKGKTKKEAKQESAKKFLELLDQSCS